MRSFLLGDGENISHKFEASQLMSFMELKTETPNQADYSLRVYMCGFIFMCVCVLHKCIYISHLIEGQTLSVGGLIHRNAA